MEQDWIGVETGGTTLGGITGVRRRCKKYRMDWSEGGGHHARRDSRGKEKMKKI